MLSLRDRTEYAVKVRHGVNRVLGAIQVLSSADGGGGCRFSGKKHYEGVMLNVISVTRG